MYSTEYLEFAHTKCYSHRQEIEEGKLCGCFCCLQTFKPNEILNITKKGLLKEKLRTARSVE